MITKMPKDITGRIIEVGYDCVYASCNQLHYGVIIGLTDTRVCIRLKNSYWKSYVYPHKLYMIKNEQ